MTRALVIARRRKGRKMGQVVRDAAGKLRAAGWTVDTSVVDRKRELRRKASQAAKDQADIVIAVGGDGAVLQVVQALADKPLALGIIPMGTGNLLATNLGIPADPDKAIDVLLNGSRKRVDVGQLQMEDQRELFTVACGVGFDADVMKVTRKRTKLRWGKLAYVAAAIGQRRRIRNVVHEITLDGLPTTMKATQVFLANFGDIGFAMAPRLDVEPDDGYLDVIAIRASGPLPALLAGWEALRQDHVGMSANGHAYRAKAREVRIQTKASRLVEVDGSVVGTTPITASIRPAALTVIVPAS